MTEEYPERIADYSRMDRVEFDSALEDLERLIKSLLKHIQSYQMMHQ